MLDGILVFSMWNKPIKPPVCTDNCFTTRDVLRARAIYDPSVDANLEVESSAYSAVEGDIQSF